PGQRDLARGFARGPRLRRLNGGQLRLRLRGHLPLSPCGTTVPPVLRIRGHFWLDPLPVNLFAQSARTTCVTSLYSVPARVGPAVRRFGPSLLRLVAGVTVLWFLGRELGAAPFEAGLRAVTWQGVVAAATLTALT